MNLGNALDMYNKMLEQFGQTCADTTDSDDNAVDDTVVDEH